MLNLEIRSNVMQWMEQSRLLATLHSKKPDKWQDAWGSITWCRLPCRLRSFSLELAALCRDSKIVWVALGQVDYGRKSSEQGNVKFRRSLYFVKDIEVGEVITDDSTRSVRPGYGLALKYWNALVDQILKHDAKAKTLVTQEIID